MNVHISRAGLAATIVVGLLLGVAQAGNIVWVTEPKGPDGMWDKGWTDLLEADGHTVLRRDDMTELDQAKIDEMNAADLVIISRSTNSGNYDDGTEPQDWNGITSPMMLMSPFLTRSSRWKWIDTTDAGTNTQEIMATVDPNHPIFGGVITADMVDETLVPGDEGVVTNGTADVGNGTMLATTQADGNVWVALWEPGVEFYNGSGETPADYRLFFALGNHNGDNQPDWGADNSTPVGEQLFLNATNYMLAVPEPSTMVLAIVGGLALLGLRRRRDR